MDGLKQHFFLLVAVLVGGYKGFERPFIVGDIPDSDHEHHFTAFQCPPLLIEVNIHVDEKFEIDEKLVLLFDRDEGSAGRNPLSRSIGLEYCSHEVGSFGPEPFTFLKRDLHWVEVKK